MRTRKVVTRSGRGFRGFFPSNKLSRMVAWESTLERDAILLFEFSPGVVSYQEQPEMVLYHDGDVIRRYFPDFEVKTTGGNELHIEIKVSRRLEQPNTADKYRAIATHYRSQNRRYTILTELEIRREPLFSNLKMLARHHRYGETLVAGLSQVAERLREGPVAFGALGLDKTIIWRLLSNGHLSCDLAAPITASTLMSLPEGGSDDTLLF